MKTRRLWWQAVALLMAARVAGAEPLPLPDDAVKAAVIYKVMLFTEWPNALPEEAPLTLCVLGRDEVAAALPDLQGRKVGERTLLIRTVTGQSPLTGCSAAYIASSERYRLHRLTSNAASNGLMTVVDCGRQLCSSDAVLSLAVEDGKLIFAVNREQAQQQRLVFSAQVLRLSRTEAPQ
jgi:hypothetical protein